MRGLKQILLATVTAATLTITFQSHALPQLNSSMAAKNLDRISFANRITAYQPVDARHLVLVTDETMNYLLSLQSICHELRFARHIAVSNSNNTIYAGFDHVLADGRACTIERIQAISPEMAQRLK